MTRMNETSESAVHNQFDYTNSAWKDEYNAAVSAELGVRAFILKLQAKNDNNINSMVQEALDHLIDVKDEIANRIASELSGVEIVHREGEGEQKVPEGIERLRQATRGRARDVNQEQTEEQNA